MLSRFSRSFLIIALVLFILLSLALFHPPESARTYIDPISGRIFGADSTKQEPKKVVVEEERVEGSVMPALKNETARKELGRATWRLMHTMTLRFPKEPTQAERDSLNDYFHLMGKLYPCGDCAAHFRVLLDKFPPQTSSRTAASNWLCHVHNQVNERLGKPEFDCARLGDTYDCGCGSEGDEKEKKDGSEADRLGANEGPVKGGR